MRQSYLCEHLHHEFQTLDAGPQIIEVFYLSGWEEGVFIQGHNLKYLAGYRKSRKIFQKFLGEMHIIVSHAFLWIFLVFGETRDFLPLRNFARLSREFLQWWKNNLNFVKYLRNNQRFSSIGRWNKIANFNNLLRK